MAIVHNYPDAPPDLASIQAALAGYNVALGLSAQYRELFDLWPRYPKDQYYDVFATSSTPIMMLQGDLDFIPLAAVQPVADNFNAANQHYAVLPGTPHGAFGQAPLANGSDCTGTLVADFLESPDTVDMSCIGQMLPPDFTPDPTLSAVLFGTADAYEGDPGPVNAAAVETPTHPQVTELLRRLRTLPL